MDLKDFSFLIEHKYWIQQYQSSEKLFFCTTLRIFEEIQRNSLYILVTSSYKFAESKL